MSPAQQPLASGAEGPAALRPLLATVLDALHEGAVIRGGPLPVGGPGVVAARLRAAVGAPLPQHGAGADAALRDIVRAVSEGAADPADPLCAAHLHCPPLAVAAAADLAASVLNPSMDSWDQAPAASELEALVTRAIAAEVYPVPAADGHPPEPVHPGEDRDPVDGRHGPSPTRSTPHDHPERAPAPDALVTTGGTEANQLALLLARELHGPVQLVCGANAHHSLHRAAWLLGLPAPVVVPAPRGVIDPTALAEKLRVHGMDGAPRPVLVAASAGTTDAGFVDPLPRIADVCAAAGARLHVDAAYGGVLLFSERLRPLLAGLDRAHTVTLDLHKLGWQPVAAGLLAVRESGDLDVLGHHADYLNADDDTEAGLPDLLGRSLRTTRRPDVMKIAVTLRALGRSGLGALTDAVCGQARELAGMIAADPGFELYGPPVISTVLFRPAGVDDRHVAEVRRRLLAEGSAVIGRARLGGRLWFKATLLNPHTRTDDLAALLKLVEGHTPR
jgi:L-2,4-diaminobutyrate decarboxylase